MATALKQPPGLAPRPRERKTSRAVQLMDKFSTGVITIGGISVIVAVLGILVFLAAVIIPLFRGAKISGPRQVQIMTAEQASKALFVELNEYKDTGMVFDRDAVLTIFSPKTGQIKDRRETLPAGSHITSFSRPLRGGDVALGFSDGSVRLGSIQFSSGEVLSKLEDPIKVGDSAADVILLDYKVNGDKKLFTALKADGELSQNEVSSHENLIDSTVTHEVENHKLPFSNSTQPPAFLLQNAQGDQVYIAWNDGVTRRYDLRQIDHPTIAETRNLTPTGAALTDLRFVLGDQSLVACDSKGGVTVWFRVERPGSGSVDGYQLVPAYTLAKR